MCDHSNVEIRIGNHLEFREQGRQAYVMDDGSRRGDAPLDNLHRRSGSRRRSHHDLGRRGDGSWDWNLHSDRHGLRDRVHASETLDGAKLVVDGGRARLRAHDGADLAVHERARVHVSARDGLEG